MPIRARWALAGAVTCVLLLVATWFVAFHVGVFRNADQSTFAGFADLYGRSRIHAVASFVAPLCDVEPYVFLAVIPIAVALVRRRPKLVVTVALILLGANVTTQALKPLLAEPRAAALFGGSSPISPESWPSGHATAAMSLALACVIAVPAGLRPAVATLGALFAVAVSYSFLTLGWHYPSDVFGGFLVAAAWALAAVAALRIYEHRKARGPELTRHDPLVEALGPAGAGLITAIVLAGVLVLASPHQAMAYTRGHTSVVAGAAAIAALSFALSTAIALSVRR